MDFVELGRAIEARSTQFLNARYPIFCNALGQDDLTHRAAVVKGVVADGGTALKNSHSYKRGGEETGGEGIGLGSEYVSEIEIFLMRAAYKGKCHGDKRATSLECAKTY